MKLLCLFVLFVAVYAKHEEYIGWKSYFVSPSNYDQLKALGSKISAYDIDVLGKPSVEREGLVLIKPQHQEAFTQFLNQTGIKFNVHKNDVKAALEEEDVLFETRRQESKARNGGRTLPYDSYQDWYVIEEYMEEVAARNPALCELVIAGYSFEGRPLKYLKVSTTRFQDQSKPVIFIDGGIHAREWISPPTVAYAIHKLVEDRSTDVDLLQNFDWILFPVVNPDGYQFTFEQSRFWRKTRSIDGSLLSGVCPGVDGNRNYDFMWNTVGSSSFNCDDTFAGSQAFSEVETRAVRDIIFEFRHRMPLYLTMHSYGSMILYPWGHDGSLSDNALLLHQVGVNMATAIDAIKLDNFPKYIVGNSVLVIGYPASGAAEDYAHSVGIPLSYTYELPGLAGGFEGFHLDPIYVYQVSKETWEGIVVGARMAASIYH